MKYTIFFLLICTQFLSLKAQDLKFGLGFGIGVNSQRYSSLVMEGDVNIFGDFPQWQTPESFLFNAYIERSLNEKWGLIAGLEANEFTFKQTATGGSLNVRPYRYYWQGNIHFMISRYFRISELPNRLKVAIGPEFSIYPREFGGSSNAYWEEEYLFSQRKNLSRFNFSSKFMLLYNSKLTAESYVNIGFLVNLGIYNPIENNISYYQSDKGFGNPDTPYRVPAEKYLSHRITRVLHPVHFMFVIQYELERSKKSK